MNRMIKNIFYFAAPDISKKNKKKSNDRNRHQSSQYGKVEYFGPDFTVRFWRRAWLGARHTWTSLSPPVGRFIVSIIDLSKNNF